MRKPHGPALRFVKVARRAPTTVLPFAFSKSACARRHKRLAAFNTAPPAVVSMIVRLRPSVGDGVIFTYFRRSSGRKFLPHGRAVKIEALGEVIDGNIPLLAEKRKNCELRRTQPRWRKLTVVKMRDAA